MKLSDKDKIKLAINTFREIQLEAERPTRYSHEISTIRELAVFALKYLLDDDSTTNNQNS